MAADSAGRGGSLELMIRVNAGLGRGSCAKTVTLPEAWFGQAHPGQGVQNIVVLDFKSVSFKFEYEWHAYVGRCSREVNRDERGKLFFCHLRPKIGVDLSALVGGAWGGSGR